MTVQHLSRYRLATFLTCPRRFELRFLQRLSWPAAPLDERVEFVRSRGEEFHRLMERHFLGLPIITETIDDVELRRWWSLFQNSKLRLPEGTKHPERSLTIPIGRHFLNGRFDLLILHKKAAHLFDWKTGQPQKESNLRRDWQTRLYLAMLSESEQALGHTLDPEQITITYWYVNEPVAPSTIHYSQDWHRQNWAEIQEVVAQLDNQLTQDNWPLTDDWSHCRQCAYQSFCGRQETTHLQKSLSEPEAEQPDEFILSLEPELP